MTRLTDIVGNHHNNQYEKEPVMKAEKEETISLLNISGKCSVKTCIQVPVKGITDRSLVKRANVKDGK